jgi:hypothetical protein
MIATGDLAVAGLLFVLALPLPMAMWMVATGRGGVADALTAFLPHVAWYSLLGPARALGLKTVYMTNLVLELPLVSFAVVLVFLLRLRMPERLHDWKGLVLAVVAAISIFMLFPSLQD